MFLAHFVENLNLFHMEVSKLEGMKNDQNVLVSTVYFPFLLRRRLLGNLCLTFTSIASQAVYKPHAQIHIAPVESHLMWAKIKFLTW